MDPRQAVAEALRQGNADQALIILKAELAKTPKDDQLLGYQAMADALKGRHSEAKARFEDAMRHAPDAGSFLKHGSNLAVCLARIGARNDLLDLAKAEWRLAEAGSCDSFDLEALKNLCSAMQMAEQYDFLAAHLPELVASRQTGWEVERALLLALCKLGRTEEALTRIRAMDFAWREEPACIAIECFATASTKRSGDALHLLDKYVEKAAPYISRSEKTQLASLVVISRKPYINTLLRPLSQQHLVIGNFPAQIANLFAERYRITAVFAGAGAKTIERALSTTPLVAINNCVNSEALRDHDTFATVCATEAMTGLRIVNPAAQAVRSSRQENALRLADLPGAVIPRVARYRLLNESIEDVTAAILVEFQFPFILRLVGLQQGAGMFLITDKASLTRTLQEITEPHVYVLDYIGQRHASGYFRRVRAAFVRRVPTIMRADYSDHWVVHGRKFQKNQEFYAQNPTLLRDADEIVSKPEARLGKAALMVLAEIGKIIPLDIFGVDFDVNAEGRLMFFEANASMNLLSNAPPDMDYPASAERDFMARVDRLLTGQTFH